MGAKQSSRAAASIAQLQRSSTAKYAGAVVLCTLPSSAGASNRRPACSCSTDRSPHRRLGPHCRERGRLASPRAQTRIKAQHDTWKVVAAHPALGKGVGGASGNPFTAPLRLVVKACVEGLVASPFRGGDERRPAAVLAPVCNARCPQRRRTADPITFCLAREVAGLRNARANCWPKEMG